MIRNIKKFGSQVSIVIILFMLVTSVPIGTVGYSGFASAEQDQQDIQKAYNGQAEAIAPVVVGGGALGGAIVGFAGSQIATDGGYFAGKFSKDGKEALEDQVNGSIDNATNTTLRQATHTQAIVSEGTTQSYLDNVDNDIDTVEGSLKQQLSRHMIKEASNITSQTEAITTAEGRASTYLNTTQFNLVEKQKFDAKSVATYVEQLKTANADGDVYASKIDNPKIVRVSTMSDILKAPSDTDILSIQNDITNSSINSANTFSDLDMIDLNGHSVNNNRFGVVLDNPSPDMVIYGDGGSIKTTKWIVNGVNLNNQVDLVDVDIDGQLRDVNFAVASSATAQNTAYGSDNTNAGEAGSQSENRKIYQNVILDNGNVQDSNINNVVEFGNDTYTGINVPVSSSYSDKSNAEVIMPYVKIRHDALTVRTLDHNNGESLLIETSSSGVSDVAEPMNFTRYVDQIQERDSVSDSSYSFVSTFATDVWNNNIKEVANDADKTIYDDSNITQDLATFSYPELTKDNPEAILGYYTGIYESTTNPVDDELTISRNGNEVATGALFSTDVKALVGGNGTISEGDQINTTNVEDTIIVNKNTAEKKVLDKGKIYNVTNVSGEEKTSVDLRTYDLKSNDLSELAKQLDEASDTAQKTADQPQKFLPTFPDLGGNGRLVFVLIGLVLVGWVVGRSN